MLAGGLFFFGLGLSLLIIGGSGIATAEIVRGGVRGGRALLFFVVAGLSILAIGSAVVAHSFKQHTVTKSGEGAPTAQHDTRRHGFSVS